MKIKGKEISLLKIFCLFVYYSILQYLPSTTTPIAGKISKKLRYYFCKRIFKICGKNVNIERRAFFGSGISICIGDNSGIGKNCVVPSDIIIGKNVMMGPYVYILASNHKFDRIDIPICEQGFSERKKTIIEDDIWIGRQVILTPGRIIKKGTIIAAGSVLTKDFPGYSIVGGNPAKLIRSRL